MYVYIYICIHPAILRAMITQSPTHKPNRARVHTSLPNLTSVLCIAYHQILVFLFFLLNTKYACKIDEWAMCQNV